ncbi:hydroxypyruvate isomerase [Xaviernesmea oryzae]|uniref:Hydroxypyruvate isomerase n=1 Tax=Xaviernesmea oryzae TaxID=464029 RepID=A0A1X7E0X3_9HYPH|nr:TIM barrel protein [Xaviernesmea oryzae]SMF25446.1 hydroxypyruvate isomerase [Xaviernesmea oryzae]
MKTKYGYSAHVGYLFQDLPFADRFAAAKTYGFEAVEFPSPYHVSPNTMAQLLEDNDLAYVQFGLHAGDPAKGEKGIGIFPQRVSEFIDSVGAGLEYAQAIGVRLVHAMAGVLPQEDRRREHWDCYVSNLVFAADMAAERGMDILIEPMSPAAVPGYYIDTPEVALKAAREAGKANIRLLVDVFHTASVGLNVAEEIRRCAGLIAHVHLSDLPGRHEPGSGMLDFGAIYAALSDIRYSGRLGCEYVPAGDTVAGLGWMNGLLPA